MVGGQAQRGAMAEAGTDGDASQQAFLLHLKFLAESLQSQAHGSDGADIPCEVFL